MRRPVLVAVAIVLAGCTQAPPPAAPGDPGASVEGWVVDVTLRPIAGTNVSLVGNGSYTRTDEAGHYGLNVPTGEDLVVTASAPGFIAQSRSARAFSGAVHMINFTLERVPNAAPYQSVDSFNGFLQCAVTVVALEDQGTPHTHQGAGCSSITEDTRNVWRAAIPRNATGLVVETAWEPNSELSQGLVMKIVVDGSGDVLGFVEGRSILRVQVGQENLLRNVEAGHTTFSVTIEAGAGTGEHEHGAVGVFYEQQFTIYATAFYNGPADPSYSIANRE